MTLAFSTTVITQMSDLEHAVAQIPDLSLLDADGLALRIAAPLWLELMSAYDTDAKVESVAEALEVQAQAVARRAPGISVFAVPDGHSAATAQPPYVARHAPRLLFSGDGGAAVFQPVDSAKVAEIRQQDLSQCIEAARTRCVICAASNFHFALPSGAHASQFLRLAEAFVDIESVDRVAYWVALHIESKLPPLQGSGHFALLVDHPSMLILAARVQLLVSVRLEVVAFPTYPSDVETRTATFDLLKRVSARCPRVFVLIGVASTGRLVRFIDRWARESPNVDVDPTILYSVQAIDGASSLCRLELPEYRHFASADSCELCSTQSHPVAIQSANYMVGYAPAQPVALQRSFFDEQRPFLERWGQHPGVLRVHYNDPNEATARHHAFYVDVGTLLNLEEFQEELLAAVRILLPKPDGVAVPDHPTALRIGRLASEALGVPLILLDAALLSKGQGPVDSTLAEATCLLVLDDVLISGTRLDVINRFLREYRAERAPKLDRIHFLTLLATPSSGKKYQERLNGLTGNHAWTATLSHLHKFILPDWHSDLRCPWCREQAVLSRLAQSSGEFDGPLADRLADLSNPDAGLYEAAYFVAAKATVLPGLGSNSALLHAGATPLQVLFACASAVQQLRHADKNALNAEQFPVPTYIAERVFAANYTERVIWLGLLRSLKGNELEPLLKACLRRAALDESDEQRHLVHAELAMAWIAGKLDAIEVSAPSRRFFETVGIPWQSLFDTGLVDGHP
jgi:hypothetical protein